MESSRYHRSKSLSPLILFICALFLLLALLLGLRSPAVCEPAGDKTKASPPKDSASAAPVPGVTPNPPLTTGFLCEADVYYEWITPAEVEGPQRQTSVTKPNDAAANRVFFSRFSESGSSQAAATAKLSQLLPGIHERALDRCRDEHQNKTSCVSSKLQSLHNDYTTADYATRRAILESITTDCRATFGKCLKASNTEIHCAEDTPPPPPAAAPEGQPKAAEKTPPPEGKPPAKGK